MPPGLATRLVADEILANSQQHVSASGESRGLNAHIGRPPLWKRLWRRLSLYETRKRRSNDRRRRAALKLLDEFPRHPASPRHGLPAPLVVSLTSYPPRYPTLHLTIKSLLDQTVRPDRIILWLAHGDADSLPREVTELEGPLFTVRQCEDLRSFNKIIPLLRAEPESFIVVADDDLYYHDRWLETLVDAYDPDEPTIVCHRAHEVAYDQAGRLAPYHQWQLSVSGEDTERPRTDLFPTNCGGVLYPPGSLPPPSTDAALIRELCSTCDDSWLYFMWRKAGWKAKRVPGPKPKLIEWPGTQAQSLWSFHLGGRKDEHLQAMSDRFGVPR